MHRVIHLDAFPTMIVVVFVEHEVESFPSCGEEGIVTFIVRHVLEFIDPPPVIPLKALVEFGLPFKAEVLVYGILCRTLDRPHRAGHIVVGFISLGRIVVEVKRDERFAKNAPTAWFDLYREVEPDRANASPFH